MNKPPAENNQTCSCGRHRGVGKWSAEKRAAVYAFVCRKRISSAHQREYLASWERYHGRVVYDGDTELIPNEVTPQEIQNRRYGE